MNYKFIILRIFTLNSILFNSCSKPTEACFTYSLNKTLQDSLLVVFNASCSQNTSQFLWNFGDGSKDTIVNSPIIQYRYNIKGEYNVKLNAKSKDGVSVKKGNNSKTMNIIVN